VRVYLTLEVEISLSLCCLFELTANNLMFKEFPPLSKFHLAQYRRIFTFALSLKKMHGQIRAENSQEL
jgi:hypothetical protein